MDSIEFFVRDEAALAVGESGKHEEIATLAYAYWTQRGCPAGNPEVDWFRAEEQLRNQARLAATAEALIAKTLTR